MNLSKEIPVSNTLPSRLRATGLPLYLGAGIFMQEKQEIWKPVFGHEKYYEVSDMGRVKTLQSNNRYKPGDIVAGWIDQYGYRACHLRGGGENKTKRFHAIIATTFIGPKPINMEVCHNDGDKMNNRLSNLRYDTRKNNILDKYKHGTIPIGEQSWMTNLKNTDVIEIKKLLKTGMRQCDIARKFGVSDGVINKIKTGHSWGHIKEH